MTVFIANFLSILLGTIALCMIGIGLMDRWPWASKTFLIVVLLGFSISINWLVVRDIQRVTLESCIK